MRFLVLGGTVFLSRTVAETARDAGHEVTCANRGVSGNPPDGVEVLRIDRDEPDGLAPLTSRDFDAVVDVERQSLTRVRAALDVLGDRTGHWTYVSSGSVYTDDATAGQDVASSPIESPPPEGSDESDGELYGRWKVACENEVSQAVGDRAFLCRAGLIVGPRDISDRFGYWPTRLARGGEILAPGGPEDLVQFIDVRDLAGWIVHCAENRITGTFDGIAAATSRGGLLTTMLEAIGGPNASLTWVPTDWLVERSVPPWAGPDSLPLWLPLPDYAGFMSRDVSASLAAGLRTRSTDEIASAALEWEQVLGPDRDRRSGLTAERETELLIAWHGGG